MDKKQQQLNGEKNSAKFTTNGDIAKINSAKFANFGAVNRENKFGENLCSKGNKYKIIFWSISKLTVNAYSPNYEVAELPWNR